MIDANKTGNIMKQFLINLKKEQIELSKYINIKDNQGNYKDTIELLDELSKKFKKLSNEEKQYISEIIGGKRYKNNVKSLLEQYNKKNG